MAFIVKKAMKASILGFEPVNNRISSLRIRTQFFNIAIINIYAPTEEIDEETKEIFYQELEQAYNRLFSNDIKIIVGDANAKIGKEEIYFGTIGSHSLHDESNNNGLRLIDFASGKNMRISSTYFPHKNIHKGTWMSPDHRTTNQIDHILIENRGASSILDVRSFRGACCGTDHFLVKIRFRARILMVQQLTR